MPTTLSLLDFDSHYNTAVRVLAEAMQSDHDTERQRTLALLGQAYATLAQVAATDVGTP